MHILILPSWYFAADSDSIAGRNFHQLARGLREANIDARIFYSSYSPVNSFFKKYNYHVEDGIPTWRVKQWFPPKLHALLISFWINKYAKDVMKYIRENGIPDVIHAQSYMASLIANQVSKKTNIPFIYTEHLSGFIEESIPLIYKNHIEKSSHGAAMITCVSPGLKSKLEGYTNNNINVIPNFFDADIFYPDNTIIKNKIFTWISIGEPSYIKGLDILINAYALVKQRLPEAEMQLIIIDEIKDKDKLVQLATIKNVAESIKWTGLINHPEIARILNESHAIISASRVETFGTAIVEAQACGLPVVASQTDGASFIIQSSEQGILTTVNDADALADGMVRLFANYNFYNSEKIFEIVKQRFEKRVIINQWKEIYKIVAK